ncbi:MAG TPA: hypothetical protein VKZ53_23015 [Candidatus Angelobacter sp.]|nr:hypothetical protein [Candidatus Angelobacter sp.]
MRNLLVSSLLLILFAALLMPVGAVAHVGSPDVYFEGYAGSYHLLITIRTPEVIPGVAQIQVRNLSNNSADIGEIAILPVAMQGPGADLAPRPDTMQRSPADPQIFNGNLWIMLRGSWKVQITVDGKQGKSVLAVPVAAVSMTAAHMNRGFGMLLGGLGFILVAALVSIVRAANGEAQLSPGEKLNAPLKRRSRIGMSIGIVVVLAILIGGNLWWGSEASANERMTYHIPQVTPTLQSGNHLLLHLENPNSKKSEGWEYSWTDRPRMGDLVPDHGHLMHLFLVRMPDMKSFWHLHPEQVQSSDGEFTAALPSLPAGHYQIFADVVHGSGFPETQIGSIDLPEINGASTAGDDSGNPDLSASETVAQLSDGYHMVWERDSAPLHAKQPVLFRFRIEDKDGKPATDLENYMGMAGHAVFLGNGGKVFAHVHPEGSISMAALSLAQGQTIQKQAGTAGANDKGGDASQPTAKSANGDSGNSSGNSNDMPGMNMMAHAGPSAEVSFPYGFPQAGDYRLFVQIKRAGRVETGSFTAHVDNPGI